MDLTYAGNQVKTQTRMDHVYLGVVDGAAAAADVAHDLRGVPALSGTL